MSEPGNGRERELHIGFGRAPGHLLIIAEMRASRDPSPGSAAPSIGRGRSRGRARVSSSSLGLEDLLRPGAFSEFQTQSEQTPRLPHASTLSSLFGLGSAGSGVSSFRTALQVARFAREREAIVEMLGNRSRQLRGEQPQGPVQTSSAMCLIFMILYCLLQR